MQAMGMRRAEREPAAASGTRAWLTTWALIVASIWIGSFLYGRWEVDTQQVVARTALGGVDGHAWLWRGVFGSILWTGAALAMALATADGQRRLRVTPPRA